MLIKTIYNQSDMENGSSLHKVLPYNDITEKINVSKHTKVHFSPAMLKILGPTWRPNFGTPIEPKFQDPLRPRDLPGFEENQPEWWLGLKVFRFLTTPQMSQNSEKYLKKVPPKDVPKTNVGQDSILAVRPFRKI